MSMREPGPGDSTPHTRALNEAVLEALPFSDTQDFADARRGFLGRGADL